MTLRARSGLNFRKGHNILLNILLLLAEAEALKAVEAEAEQEGIEPQQDLRLPLHPLTQSQLVREVPEAQLGVAQQITVVIRCLALSLLLVVVVAPMSRKMALQQQSMAQAVALEVEAPLILRLEALWDQAGLEL